MEDLTMKQLREEVEAGETVFYVEEGQASGKTIIELIRELKKMVDSNWGITAITPMSIYGHRGAIVNFEPR